MTDTGDQNGTRESVLEKAQRLADALRAAPMTWEEQCELLDMSRASCQRVRRVMRDYVLDGQGEVLAFDDEGRHYLTERWDDVEAQVRRQLPGISTQLQHLLRLAVVAAGQADGRTGHGRQLRELSQSLTEAALAVEASCDLAAELYVRG